jgi:hypothetical protein
MTHKTLMTFATCKCDYLKTKGTWGAKSPGDKKIVAMSAALNALNSSSMTSTEMLSRAKARAKERDKVAIGRQRTRRTLETLPSRRRTRHGRRCPPSPKTKRARMLGITG